MRIALRELRPPQGEFVVATVILTLIAAAADVPGWAARRPDGLVDGRLPGPAGRLARVLVERREESLVRSRITPQERAQVARHAGGRAGRWARQRAARRASRRRPQTRDLLSTVLFGYELAPRGLPATPPATGTVVADTALRSEGGAQGDTILLGPARTPVKVVGFVADTSYSGQASLWGSLDHLAAR